MSLGLSESRAFYMVSVANGGSGIGRIGGGFLADKIGMYTRFLLVLGLSEASDTDRIVECPILCSDDINGHDIRMAIRKN